MDSQRQAKRRNITSSTTKTSSRTAPISIEIPIPPSLVKYLPADASNSSSNNQTAESQTNQNKKVFAAKIYWDVESKNGPSPIAFVDSLVKHMPELANDKEAINKLKISIAAQLTDPDGTFYSKYARKRDRQGE